MEQDQYGTKHSVLRKGGHLSVFSMDSKGNFKSEWTITYNGKGFKMSKYTYSDLVKKDIVKEDSFLYPDKVTDEDIDFVEAVFGTLSDQERSLIKLCSLLVAKWAAGHSEEDLLTTANNVVKSWSN